MVTHQSPQAQLHLARSHEAAKQPEAALKAMRAALELDPDHAEAYRGIVRIYARTGRTQEALRSARELQTKQPSNPIGYILEAETYVAQKDLGSAERVYKAALKKFEHPSLAVRTHAVLTAASKTSRPTNLRKTGSTPPADTAMLSHMAGGHRREALSSAAKRYRSAESRRISISITSLG
jgi:tetratricopeptide (TPR) repeat protein